MARADSVEPPVPKLKELMDDLIEVASKWQPIGIQLYLPQPTLMFTGWESNSDEEALMRILHEWLTGNVDVSWETIVGALKSRRVGEFAVARAIEQRRLGRISVDETILTKDASLFFLYSLPSQEGSFSVVERCAGEYRQLGSILLSSDDVRRLTLVNRYVPEAIMADVFQEWIASGEHSWRMLIDSMRKCSMYSQARDVEHALSYNGLSV